MLIKLVFPPYELKVKVLIKKYIHCSFDFGVGAPTLRANGEPKEALIQH